MNNELTLDEVGYIKMLQEEGRNIDNITKIIIDTRGPRTYLDVRTQIRRLLK